MDFEIRKVRKAQGPRKLRAEREEYLRLVQMGLTNKEASRRVDVHDRTGREWRNGRTDPKRRRVPALAEQEPVPSATRYLREDERIHIADRLREKASIRTIAGELARSPSTISREIRRNGISLRGDRNRWAYRPHAAQRRADDRRPRPKSGKIGQDTELQDFIRAHLAMRWSPEQICHALRRRFPDRPEMHVVHETIYQALY